MSGLQYSIHRYGESRSFPRSDPFLDAASDDGDVAVLIGAPLPDPRSMGDKRCVLVELGTECLAEHTGGCDEPGSSNVVGFARWRLGDNAPSKLVELVVEPGVKDDAVAAAREIFAASGFVVSVCADRAGRIVDRLIRPQFNLALRALDEGLATRGDLEQCLKLGLGYRAGLVEPLMASGLEHHCAVTETLFRAYGQAQYAPGRLALVAEARAHQR